ncbi:unnamed protein product, partial [Gongylonema pulchrum]|uniref:PPM-type phosphatase domain-containing protein n=1 Tax=Gongylonema pulchrum TaxID=637853 RepID=A0A183DVE4_9BILA
MAMKRKLISAPLSISLYDDLDSGPAATATAALSSKADCDASGDASEPKKSRAEGDSTTSNGGGPALGEEEEDGGRGGAVGELLSVCGWRKGERQDMQDAHVRHDHFDLGSISNIQRSAFYAIFDGHAGRRAADFAALHLPARLKRKIEAC